MPKTNSRGFSLLFIILIVLLGFIFIAFVIKIFYANFLNGKYDSTKTTAYFNGARYEVPKEDNLEITYNNEEANTTANDESSVLGSSSKHGEKRIEINLSKQELYAFEGDKRKYTFLVSTGKWGLTPKGEYRIYVKLKYTLMTGGNMEYGTYYYLPNVPYTMYFYQGYGIHGTYWHDNFGHPMSHGCINMRTEDARTLFYWANPVISDGSWSARPTQEDPGTRVIIYGDTPSE